MLKSTTRISMFFAFGLVVLSSSAQAACSSSPAGGSWQCLEAYNASSSSYDDITDTGLNGPYTFEGWATLQHWSVGTLNCLLTAEAEVGLDTVAGVVDVKVTSLASSGSTTCVNVTFGNLPLYAHDVDTGTQGVQDDDDVHPVVTGSSSAYLDDGSGNGLATYYQSSLICEDAIDVSFSNSDAGSSASDPSAFSYSQTIGGWLGDCTIAGTLSSDGYTDVNAW